MFDFEKLEVYQICKQQNVEVLRYVKGNSTIDPYLKESWKVTSLNIVKNMVEGVSRIPKNEKKEFITASRGFVFECVALINLIVELHPEEKGKMEEFYGRYESLSKMLLGMIRSFEINH
ncbi:MAG TPA: four helix bundle protein [Flavobacteriales bacterium]|nr:four helix bundle protein [Flavobacteriales bacterium]